MALAGAAGIVPLATAPLVASAARSPVKSNHSGYPISRTILSTNRPSALVRIAGWLVSITRRYRRALQSGGMVDDANPGDPPIDCLWSSSRARD